MTIKKMTIKKMTKKRRRRYRKNEKLVRVQIAAVLGSSRNKIKTYDLRGEK